MELIGKIVQIKDQRESDWGRYVIRREDGVEYLAVGVISGAAFNTLVHLDGKMETNKYGTQYMVSKTLSVDTDDTAGIYKFLTDCIRGLGQHQAESLIAMYGDAVPDIFESENSEAMLTKVRGIGKKKYETIMKSYSESSHLLPVYVFLNGIGTENEVNKIYEKYKGKTLSVLKKNPYVLQMDIDGFGFKKVDKLALASGIKANSIFRIAAGIKYLLDTEATAAGHCFLTTDEIYDKIYDLLCPIPKAGEGDATGRITNALASKYFSDWDNERENFITRHTPSAEYLTKIDEAEESRKLIRENIVEALQKAIEENYIINDDGNIYTKAMFDNERLSAKMLVEMKMQNPVRFIKKETIESCICDVENEKNAEFKKDGINSVFEITDEQRKAIYTGLMNRVSIVSGGPGRGKTAIIGIIARAFLSSGDRNKQNVVMLAPTGRAAQRITESTGYNAMTIHRALIQAEKDNAYPTNKLIVCDESSMIDVSLLRRLLEYAADSNLIFVGDADQIPSVGPGSVLRDMIHSGEIPCVMLTQGHRNSGSIATNSQMINSGIKPSRFVYDAQFSIIPASSENIKEKMIHDYLIKVGEYGIENVMMCTAMRERGPIAVNTLNKEIQAKYTLGQPEAKFKGGRMYRIGDRVMQTKNNYKMTLISKETGSERQGVFNGERGTVENLQYNSEEETYEIVVKFDDGYRAIYDTHTIEELSLAYVTTIHKCQGSEAACMMMGYTFADFMLMNRSLFYTGETRAKKEFIGYEEVKRDENYGYMKHAFDLAVNKTDDSKRNTALKEKIKTEATKVSD